MSVKYSSSKKSVATVDKNGIITAKKKGTATITATLYNNVKKP
ncbi:MAG: Ig-like domain-containing protein [Clostridiales bacterium]|nr:Ig-like domain-containing protein [Clostridiales bacterium]